MADRRYRLLGAITAAVLCFFAVPVHPRAGGAGSVHQKLPGEKPGLALLTIPQPTRIRRISHAVFCL